ncbi:MAG: chromate transporter [Treponema sp.]|nr:chromate transporter [Treponema sp.]
MSLLHLFFIFFYIGLFAIGGGLVAATFMQQTLVEQYQLISADKFCSMLAISESTPGPIGINLATYIGMELFGPAGAVITTLGEILPSLIVIMLIARFFSRFQDKPLVKAAFSGLRPATTGMVLIAMVQVFTLSLLDVASFSTGRGLASLFCWPQIALFEACLVILFKSKLHPVVIIALGAVFGVLFL